MTDFAKIVAEAPTSVTPAKDGKTGALIATYKGGVRAILKVSKRRLPDGRRCQKGLPVKRQAQREVAYRKLAELYKLDHLVPPTVLTTYKGCIASAQLFVPAKQLRDINPKLKNKSDPSWRREVIATTKMVPKSQWLQLLLLDIIAGTRDRHARNVGVQMRVEKERMTYSLVAWDNASTFGLTFHKYHNVFHKFLFRKSVVFDAMWPVLERVKHRAFVDAFADLLLPVEIDHAWRRACFFRDFPYRLPWRECSNGHDRPRDFPSYSSYFLDEKHDEVVDALSA